MNFPHLTAKILDTLTPTFIKAAALSNRLDLPRLILALNTDQETKPVLHLQQHLKVTSP